MLFFLFKIVIGFGGRNEIIVVRRRKGLGFLLVLVFGNVILFDEILCEFDVCLENVFDILLVFFWWEELFLFDGCKLVEGLLILFKVWILFFEIEIFFVLRLVLFDDNLWFNEFSWFLWILFVFWFDNDDDDVEVVFLLRLFGEFFILW